MTLYRDVRAACSGIGGPVYDAGFVVAVPVALRPARRLGPGTARAPRGEAAPRQAAEPGVAVWDLAVVSGAVVPDLTMVAEPVVRLPVRETRASP